VRWLACDNSHPLDRRGGEIRLESQAVLLPEREAVAADLKQISEAIHAINGQKHPCPFCEAGVLRVVDYTPDKDLKSWISVATTIVGNIGFSCGMSSANHGAHFIKDIYERSRHVRAVRRH